MFRINKGVFWLKLGYGLFSMALYTVLPFLALQMANQGLSDEDISFILGIMPLALIFISPFIGKSDWGNYSVFSLLGYFCGRAKRDHTICFSEFCYMRK